MPGKKRAKAFMKETAQSCFEASTVKTTLFDEKKKKKKKKKKII